MMTKIFMDFLNGCPKRLLICLALIMLHCSYGIAQNQKITGKVVDEHGEPIIGATVAPAGDKTKGTITDLDGNYTLNVPKGTKVTITYIGYMPQTVVAGTNVKLLEDRQSLDEVVVTGYGSQKMKNVTGSIEVVNAEELKDLNVTSLGEALRGMVNGLHVKMTSSTPGSAAHLTIRQSSDLARNWGSINAKFSDQDDTPLYVIDDFISDETAFNNLDMSEVESISVLKDASAAIYGAQGAYGVVLVKTKRGKQGTPKVSYSGQFGFTDRLFTPKMMSAYDYARTWNAYKGTATDAMDETRMRDYFQTDELEAMKSLDYNLLDDYWKVAGTYRHSVNVNGGTEKATYFAGITYNTQDGNLGKLDYDRWNYRAGVTANISKSFKASLQVSGNYSDKRVPRNRYSGNLGNTDSGDYALLLQHLRFIPETIDGMPIIHSGMQNTSSTSYTNMYNYYAIQNSPDYTESTSNSFSAQAALEYDFSWIKPLKGLSAKFTYSKSFSNGESDLIATKMNVYRLMRRGGSGGHLYTGDGVSYAADNFDMLTMDNGNQVSRSMSRSTSYQMNFILNYARKFGKHDISALASVEKGETENRDVKGIGKNPLSFTDGESNSMQGDENGDKTDGEWSRSESGRMSYIGRLNYAYDDRYLLQFLIRSDASTKFAPKNYWGTFPSISAGWVISEEPWFPQEKLGIGYLKVRASWGIMGRDNILAWVWMTRYGRDAGKGAVFGSNSLSTHMGYGMTIEQGGANLDAHWDKTYKTNLGIDMRIIQNKLSINLDMYKDRGREIFASYQGETGYPFTVGVKPVPENFAELDTWGFELSLGWKDKIGKNFSYWAKVSTGYTDNKVKKAAEIANPDRDDLVVGKRKDLGEWGYSCLGMFRSYQEIEEYFDRYLKNSDGTYGTYLGLQKDGVHPGMLIYKDVNGAWDPDKRQYDPTPDHKVDENDMVQISKFSSNPYGMTFNFGGAYKSFSFSGQIGASWGAYTFVPGTVQKSANNMEYYNIPEFWNDMYVYSDVLGADGKVIAPANRNGSIPNMRYSSVNAQQSTFWKVSAAELSLTQLALAYDLPKQWLNPVGISSARINVTCQNAINFITPHYKDAWSSWGGNYGYYPQLRKLTVGVNVSF